MRTKTKKEQKVKQHASMQKAIPEVSSQRESVKRKEQKSSEEDDMEVREKKTCVLRPYQARDIPRMVQVIADAIPQIPNYKMITPDKDRIRYVLEHNIQNGASFQGWVLCDSHDVPQGGGAGWCVQNLMSLDLVADDVIMWIEPEYRNYFNASILVNTYLEWAKARGAKLIRASHTGGSFPKGTREHRLYDALLQRLGFKEVGSVYHYSAYEGE